MFNMFDAERCRKVGCFKFKMTEDTQLLPLLLKTHWKELQKNYSYNMTEKGK